MAEWRGRDYVPDSDGEEEILSIDLTEEVEHQGNELSSDGFLDIDDILNSAGHVGEDSREGSGRTGCPVLAGTREPQSGRSERTPSQSLEPEKIASPVIISADCDLDDLLLSQSYFEPPNKQPARSKPGTRPLQYSSDSSDELADLSDARRRFSPVPHATELSALPSRQVDGILPTAPSSPLSTACSQRFNSSPIGSVRSLKPTSPTSNSSQRVVNDASRPNDVVKSSSSLQLTDQQQGLSDGFITAVSRPTRNLRERKAIQLHPYLLEGERYRQTLKARGLKPVRIEQDEEDHAFSRDHRRVSSPRDEAQSFTSDIDMEPTPSPPRNYLTAPWTNTTEQAYPSDADDEFPDLDTLMRRVPGSVVEGVKRRKVVHTIPRKDRLLGKSSVTVVIDKPGRANPTPFARERLGVAPPSPPSPPVSAGSNTSGDILPTVSAFRYPPGFTPVQLQTPEISSQTKQPSTLQIDEESDVEFGASEESKDVSSGRERSASGSSSDDESVPQLQEVRRKIRGVLPASWLRLDLNAQNKTSAANDQIATETPTKSLPAKGVARPISSYRSRKGSLISPLPIEILDDSFSDSSIHPNAYDQDPPVDLTHGSKYRQPPTLHDNSIESMEDNRVDFMLPPKTRPKRLSAQGKIQRNGLATSSRILKSKKDTSLFRRHKGGNYRQPKISEHVVQASKVARQPAKRRAPELSILDVTDLSATTTAPNFVRVAARTAKFRPGKGRHSPSRKHLRLTTKQDTDEVQGVLTRWRGGAIARKSKGHTQKPRSAPSQRSPLRERSANEQTYPGVFFLPDEYEDGDCSTKGRTPTKPLEQLLREKLIQQLDFPVTTIGRTIPVHRRRSGKGDISFSLQKQAPSRPAVLEANRNTRVTDCLARNDESQTRLRDFLGLASEKEGFPKIMKLHESHPSLAREPRSEPATTKRLVQRKRQPRQIDTRVSDFRQKSPPVLKLTEEQGSVLDIVTEVENFPMQLTVLQGLDRRVNCSTTLGIDPLPPGLCFDPSSFVGSGLFGQSLDAITKRDLDVAHEPMKITGDRVSFEWGTWNDTVSSGLEDIFSSIRKALQYFGRIQSDPGPACNSDHRVTHAISMHRDIVQYIAQSLSFSDPVDRCGFLQRCIVLVSGLNSDLEDLCQTPGTIATAQGTSDYRQEIVIQLSMQNLAMINQLYQLSSHALIPCSLKTELVGLLSTKLRQVLTLALSRGYNKIRDFAQNYEGPLSCAAFGDGYREAEAVVVVSHILRSKPASVGAFWQEAEMVIPFKQIGMTLKMDMLEHGWQQIFSLLKLLDVDPSGVVDRERNLERSWENWSAVCCLVKPVLQVYTNNPRGQGPNFISYCRTLLGRCLRLLRTWGWQKCEPVIYAFFDFFASIGLCNLYNEHAHGSPRFLEHLTNDLKIDIVSEDRTFHCFLKLLGAGIRTLRLTYSDPKKISGIVWRVIPNNGRQYPKDQAVSQEDLDALRNHHDLLAVLYWASPPGCRPRLNVLRNFVRIEDSHKEACHLNIRAWSNLVNFQISTNEPVPELEPFAEWCEEILSQVLRQHSLARSEVESQVRIAEYSGFKNVDKDVQESIIAKNQRQVEAILSDILTSVSRAIESASNIESARILLPKTILSHVLDLFDSKHPRINTVVQQALDIVGAFVKKATSSQASDDSQGYGDWSAFDDLLGAPAEVGKLLPEDIYESLRRLLSNSLGADIMPEDTVLAKIIQTWIKTAQLYIRQGAKVWADYIGPYGQDCWGSLRDTEQTRKFTVYFFAALLETDSSVYTGHKQLILKYWIASLVDRDALLKFQHQLTAAILNADRNNPMLSNLPFWVNPDGHYLISPVELRDRRLSLISSIMSNMRESLEFSNYHGLPERDTYKREYNELVKHMMFTMKRNYQELGQGSDVRGAYVSFVHKVVEYLQQHAVGICPVDSFFLDPAAFPLPAKDPTYVVGRLKSYGFRLQDPKTAKQLLTFVQAVTERAIAEGQQEYLIDQLTAAMANDFDVRNPAKPTLRSFLLQAIFPAYIEQSTEATSGALLAMPVLQALEQVFRNMSTEINAFEELTVVNIENTIFGFLEHLKASVWTTIYHPQLFQDPLTLRLICSQLNAVREILPTLDYVARLRVHDEKPLLYATFFRDFMAFVTDMLLAPDDLHIPPDNEIEAPPIDEQTSNIRFLAVTELKKALQQNWSYHDNRLYYTRRGTRMEISTNIGTLEEEKRRFFDHAQRFHDVLAATQCLDGDGRGPGNEEGYSRVESDEYLCSAWLGGLC